MSTDQKNPRDWRRPREKEESWLPYSSLVLLCLLTIVLIQIVLAAKREFRILERENAGLRQSLQVLCARNEQSQGAGDPKRLSKSVFEKLKKLYPSENQALTFDAFCLKVMKEEPLLGQFGIFKGRRATWFFRDREGILHEEVLVGTDGALEYQEFAERIVQSALMFSVGRDIDGKDVLVISGEELPDEQTVRRSLKNVQKIIHGQEDTEMYLRIVFE